MNSTLKNLCNVDVGTVVSGKWHKRQYIIMRRLGSGATGIVYLAHNNNKYVALKMSSDGMAITSEVNVLKSLKKVQGSFLGPSLLDVDDWEKNGRKISFYVMEYIEGPDLLTFINGKERDWTLVITLQLLTDLQTLHNSGWIFGDLKPDNLIVSGPPTRIRCIDVGGTTMQNRAIKEYTEFFDRGYWGLGSRKAEPTYDLFAVAMIMINIAYPNRFPKKSGGIDRLKLALQNTTKLTPFEPVIIGALQGQFKDATEMREELLYYSRNNTKRGITARRKPISFNKPRNSTKQTKGSHVCETAIILFIVSSIYVVYIFLKLM